MFQRARGKGYAARVKRIFFYCGWALLVGAFLAGAAEPLASSTGRGLSSLLVPAYDLWYAVAPHSLVMTQIRIEKIAPALWDPVIVSALLFPAWLLLGIPGGLLTWFLRPHREISDEMREDLEHYRESLLIIETLSKDARDDEEMRDAYRDGGLEANYPSFDEMQEWHRPLIDENVDPDEELVLDDDPDDRRGPSKPSDAFRKTTE